MKSFLLVMLSMGILGIGLAITVGGASTKPLVPNGQREEAEMLMQAVRAAVKERSAKQGQVDVPTAYCAQPIHRFGVMDPLTIGKHVFEIENRGDVPLVLRGGGSSCKCTLSDLDEAVVAPGQSYSVQLTWNSGHARREFEQSAIVRTNDPTYQEIQLIVTGEVRAVLAALPTEVNFDRLMPSTTATRQFVLYSQIWDEMTVERVESTNEHLTATVSEQGFSESYAFDDEIKNATTRTAINVQYNGQAPRGKLSGYLRIYLRPPTDWKGVSLPTEGQAIENTALPNVDYPMQDDGTILAEIPVFGNVVRRLSLYGQPIHSAGYVDLGTINPESSRGQRWTIIGRIRGEHLPESIQAEVTGIPGLQVRVEAMDASKARNSFRLSLEITEAMRPSIYTREQAGTLVVTAPGMPAGDERLEFPVQLIVIQH